MLFHEKNKASRRKGKKRRTPISEKPFPGSVCSPKHPRAVLQPIIATDKYALRTIRAIQF